MTPRRSRLPQVPFHSGAAVRHSPSDAPDWAGRAVLAMLFLAAVALLSLPQARGASAAFGWLPLWLLGLPATAWLALAVARRQPGSR